MTDTGFLSAGTTSNDGVGDTAWSNMTNAASSNDSYMTAALGSGTKTTQTGLFTNFGFSIPTGATILGVEVLGERKTSTGTRGKDQTVQLIKGGTQQGDNKASATAYTTSDVQVTYGGPTDLWGLTLSYSDINASNFGVAFRANNNASGSATVSVDVINIKVYYSAGDATATPSGVSSTTAAGTIAATASSTASPSGVSSTTAAGTIHPAVSALPSGVATTGGAGTTAATASSNAPATGVSSAASAGNVQAASDANIGITGVSSSGNAGNITASASGSNATASISGVVGYAGLGAYLQDENGIPILDESGAPILVEPGDPGTVTASASGGSANGTANLTGVASTAAAGSPAATADSTAALTGVSSAAAAGDTTASISDAAAIEGTSSTTAAGNVTASATGNATASLTGVASTTAAGTTAAASDSTAPVTGVSSAASAGNASAIVSVAAAITGVASTASAGSPAATADSTAALTGVASTTAAGNITAGVSVSPPITGVASTGDAGTATAISADGVARPSGSSAAGYAGSMSFAISSSITIPGVASTGYAGGITAYFIVAGNDGNFYLVEVTVYDPDLEDTKTLYYSETPGYRTEPSDTPANQVFEPRVISAGNFEQHIYRSLTTGGRSEVGFGVVVLNNADGGLDGLIDYGFDGRPLVIKRGEPDWDYSDFRTVFTGTMEQAELSFTKVTLRLRNRQAEVADKPLQSVKYAGNNSLPSGVEGVADDLKGKPKPILKGVALNFAPPQVNSSRLIYQISSKQIASIQNVYDQGANITAGTSRASLAALESNTPTAGQFDYYLGSGSDGAYIRLGSTPSGIVTVDATEGASSANRTAAQIAKSLLIDFGGISSGDVDSTAVTALDTANSAEVGFWQGTDEARIGDLLDRVLQSVGAFWTVNSAGKFVVGRLQLPSGTATATIENYHNLEVERIASEDQLGGLPAYRASLAYQPNYTVQDGADLAGSVTEARKNFLKESVRTVIDTDSSVLTVHPMSPELAFQTLLNSASDAATEVSRLLTLFKTRRDVVHVKLPTGQFPVLNLNDVVTMKLDRFGWDSGKDFRVLGKIENYESSTLELILWG